MRRQWHVAAWIGAGVVIALLVGALHGRHSVACGAHAVPPEVSGRVQLRALQHAQTCVIVLGVNKIITNRPKLLVGCTVPDQLILHVGLGDGGISDTTQHKGEHVGAHVILGTTLHAAVHVSAKSTACAVQVDTRIMHAAPRPTDPVTATGLHAWMHALGSHWAPTVSVPSQPEVHGRCCNAAYLRCAVLPRTSCHAYCMLHPTLQTYHSVSESHESITQLLSDPLLASLEAPHGLCAICL